MYTYNCHNPFFPPRATETWSIVFIFSRRTRNCFQTRIAAVCRNGNRVSKSSSSSSFFLSSFKWIFRIQGGRKNERKKKVATSDDAFFLTFYTWALCCVMNDLHSDLPVTLLIWEHAPSPSSFLFCYTRKEARKKQLSCRAVAPKGGSSLTTCTPITPGAGHIWTPG